MRKLILQSTKGLITQLQEGEIKIDAFLEQHCDENNGKVEWSINELHLGDGGCTSVSNYEIDKAEFYPETLDGNFEINYTIDYYYGCDDMNNSQEFDTTCEFEIDRANQILTLLFEEIPEREPDTY